MSIEEIAKAVDEAFRFELRNVYPDVVKIFEATADKAWSTSVKEHLAAKTPKAYRRTGGLGATGVVKASGILPVQGSSGEVPTTVFGFTIKMQPEAVLAAHQAKQRTLSEVDPSGKLAFSIKYPAMNAPLVYPGKAGVIGSMHRQTKSYLVEYLFSGPVAKNQPLVYRNLGSVAGLTRDASRGLDLYNRFLKALGLQEASSVKNSFEGTVDSTDTNSVIDHTMEVVANKLKGTIALVFDRVDK